MNRLTKTDAILIVAFLALISLPLLYILRFLDDNTLTSWRWVFERSRMGQIVLFSLGGLATSLFLSRISFPGRWYPAVLFLFSFCAVLPLWGEPEMLLDTSRYVLQAKQLKIHGVGFFFREWGSGIRAWTDLPLVPFVYGVIFKYLGETRLAIQLFTTVLFSLTVVLTERLGTALWNRETGFIGGLLLLGMPYLLIQVPLMLVDVPAMFLLTLSAFTFLRALEKGGIPRILLSAGVIFFAILTKYSLWLMLLVLPLIAVCSAREKGKTVFSRSAAVLSIAALLSGSVLLIKYDLVMEQIHLLRTYQWPGLRRWQESFSSTLFFQTHPFVSIFALLGIYSAIRARDGKFLIPGWFAVFLLIVRVERIRYLLPLFPFFALMASYGLQWVRDLQVQRFIAYTAVTATLFLAIGVYLPFLNSTSMANLRHAGRYLDTLESDMIGISVLPQRESAGNTEIAIPLLDLYTKKKLRYQGDDSMKPDPEAIAVSSLRFTWEYDIAAYYAEPDSASPFPVAIISSEAITTLPRRAAGSAARLPAIRSFSRDSGTYRYRTLVTIFSADNMAVIAHAFVPACPNRDKEPSR